MKTASTSADRNTEQPAVPQPAPATNGAVQPLAATNVVIDQVRPARIGNSGFGVLTGTFVDAATGGALYTDALAIISGRFLPTPPPRITYVANTVANGYSFIAVGRNV